MNLGAPFFVCLLALAASSTVHAEPALGTRPTLPDYAKAAVDPAFGSEAPAVEAWTRDGILAGLGQAGIDSAKVTPGRRLTVTIRGALFAYEGTLSVDTGAEAAPHVFSCQCNARDLVAKIADEVASVAPLLVEPASKPAPVTAPVVGPEPVGARDPGRQSDRPLKPKRRAGRIAGYSLLGLGGGALVTGVVLVALPPRREQLGDPRNADEINTRRPGIVVLAAGGVAVIAGGVLVALDVRRSKSKRAALVPTFGQRSVSLTLTGRF